jgi:hypothetical protein
MVGFGAWAFTIDFNASTSHKPLKIKNYSKNLKKHYCDQDTRKKPPAAE